MFGKEIPSGYFAKHSGETVVADIVFRKEAESFGCRFIDKDTLILPGSVYEAADFLDELAFLKFPDGTRVSKSFTYEGYELWWIHYGSLYTYFCEPYSRYKKLLEYLRDFRTVYLHELPYKNLFVYYLRAYGCDVVISRGAGIRSPSFLPFGVFLQIVLTLISLPMLAVERRPLMIFIGDKFEKNRDYDFRMGFVYEELRKRHIRFVEFIRSLEPWQAILRNAFVRRRPVVYSEAVTFVASFISILALERSSARRALAARSVRVTDPEERFKLSVATQYLPFVCDDVWSLRIMRWIVRLIGIKTAFITATSERNAHAVLGCKLNSVPTVGLLHGVASRYGTPYDFLTGFDGEKRFSVDFYGLWSEWWKSYYIENSSAYAPDQLYVSGPMRPLVGFDDVSSPDRQKVLSRVLLVSEQLAEPSEIVPYLRKLMDRNDLTLTLKFRPYRDGFEEWLKEHAPDILKNASLRIIRGSMQEAIANCDIVVGSYSTAALEAFMQLKIPVFIYTRKWGDYYRMRDAESTRQFFAENSEELMARIDNAQAIPSRLLLDLRERYFGDPKKNGSAWVVDKIEQLFKQSR